MRTLSVLALLLLATPLAAQTPATPPAGEELVDRVVAVVGDTAVLLSDLQFRVQQQLQATGRPLPADPVQREQLARQAMDQLVDDLVLVEAARDANTTVSDEEIRAQVEERIRTIVAQNFNGSDLRFTQALAASGMTKEQYRRSLEEQARDEALVQAFMGSRMASRARPVISEEQLRAAFEERRAALGTRPASISLQQVVINPEPNDSARARALRTAQEVLDELIKGGDFEVLAKRFSEDPSNKDQGGSLGWVRQDRSLVKEFEDVVFAMRPGQTSGIVRTEFGYHIIRVDKVRGPERQVRHILIKPEIAEADVERARVRADSVAGAIRGGAAVPPLARQYGTRSEEAEVSNIPVDQLPPAYTEALGSAAVGEVVGPVQMESPTGASFAVVKVTARREAGPYTLDDVREQLSAQLQQRQMMEQLLADLRRQVFIKILL